MNFIWDNNAQKGIRSSLLNRYTQEDSKEFYFVFLWHLFWFLRIFEVYLSFLEFKLENDFRNWINRLNSAWAKSSPRPSTVGPANSQNSLVGPTPAARRAPSPARSPRAGPTRRPAPMQRPDQHLVFTYRTGEARGRCPARFQRWGLTDVGYRQREAIFGRCSDVSLMAVCSGGRQWWWKAPVGL
jgi:hypothetical protein